MDGTMFMFDFVFKFDGITLLGSQWHLQMLDMVVSSHDEGHYHYTNADMELGTYKQVLSVGNVQSFLINEGDVPPIVFPDAPTYAKGEVSGQLKEEMKRCGLHLHYGEHGEKNKGDLIV
jgi:hypothetical protein